jgi:hypothetical protein
MALETATAVNDGRRLFPIGSGREPLNLVGGSGV